MHKVMLTEQFTQKCSKTIMTTFILRNRKNFSFNKCISIDIYSISHKSSTGKQNKHLFISNNMTFLSFSE